MTRMPAIPEHARSVAKAFETSLAQGFPLTAEQMKSAADVADMLCASDNDRAQARGASLKVAMARHNLEVAEFLDRVKRLDGGDPTDNIGVKIVDSEVALAIKSRDNNRERVGSPPRNERDNDDGKDAL
jgi:parvulin-like peptidyl-prolyl isomerase